MILFDVTTGPDAVLLDPDRQQNRHRPARPAKPLRQLSSWIARVDDLTWLLLTAVAGSIIISSTAAHLLLPPIDQARLPDTTWPIEPPTCRPLPKPLDETTRVMLNIPEKALGQSHVCTMMISEARTD